MAAQAPQVEEVVEVEVDQEKHRKYPPYKVGSKMVQAEIKRKTRG